MGRCLVNPVIVERNKSNRDPKLEWNKIYYNYEEAGEVLASFELFCGNNFEIPLNISLNSPTINEQTVKINELTETRRLTISKSFKNTKKYNLEESLTYLNFYS